MHFCNQCQNMYYIRIDGEDANKLIYYCRHCGHEDNFLHVSSDCAKDDSGSGSICMSVSKTQMKKSEQHFSHFINPYTKLDPTLPRTNKMLCPNADCATNTKSDSKREIIYIRYDDVNIKYIYLCSTCDTTWKNYEEV
jgi:DNA-directed RNA polymerase subunit M/transcription elongation factor TFIIS